MVVLLANKMGTAPKLKMIYLPMARTTENLNTYFKGYKKSLNFQEFKTLKENRHQNHKDADSIFKSSSSNNKIAYFDKTSTEKWYTAKLISTTVSFMIFRSKQKEIPV